jgi:hypothetical protein
VLIPAARIELAFADALDGEHVRHSDGHSTWVQLEGCPLSAELAVPDNSLTPIQVDAVHLPIVDNQLTRPHDSIVPTIDQLSTTLRTPKCVDPSPPLSRDCNKLPGIRLLTG